MSSRTVDVWYLCDQTLCNFDCSYCVTQATRRGAAGRMWRDAEGGERYRRVVAWLSDLPWRLRIRLQTQGEPFVSREFLAGAAALSRREHVDFVELVTNGSYRAQQFRRFAREAEARRITLWITYHPTEIPLRRVVENAVLAREEGAFVVVHGLLFPDNVGLIEDMIRRCAAEGIPTDVTGGLNYNGAYPGAGYLPVMETNPQALALYRHRSVLAAMLRGQQGPLGAPCSAGHDYLYVRPNGDVYPCSPYSSVPANRLGSALDPGFVPPLRDGAYSPCAHRGVCACKEDYLHLLAVRSALRMGPSLGYYEPAAAPAPQAMATAAGPAGA